MSAVLSRPGRWGMVVAGAAALQAGGVVVRIWGLRHGFDGLRSVAAGAPPATLVGPVVAVAAAGAATGVGRFLEWWGADAAAEHLLARWRPRVLAWAVTRRVPDTDRWVGRIGGDLGHLGTWWSRGVLQGGTAAVVLAAAVGALALISPLLSLAVFGASGLAVAVSTVWAAEGASAAAEAARARRQVSRRARELIEGAGTVLVHGRLDGERRRFRRLSRRLRDARVRLRRHQARLRGLADAGAAAGTCLVLATGALLVADGRTTPGGVVAAVLVSRQLTTPLRRLVSVPSHRRRSVTLRRRLPAGPTGARSAPPLERPPRLELTGLVPGGDRTVEVPPGAVLLVTGPTASGKSRLIEALAGLTPPPGRVRADDRDVVPTPGWAGVVTDAVPLLAGSVRRNVTYGRRVDDASASGLLRRLGLHVDPGVNVGSLTPGQRRRVELARALGTGAGLVLIDDVDRHLDDDGRRRLSELLRATPATVVCTSATADTVTWLHPTVVAHLPAPEAGTPRTPTTISPGGAMPGEPATTGSREAR